jgi:Putative beta-lactamase-inhibitor-like, PepSY-like
MKLVITLVLSILITVFAEAQVINIPKATKEHFAKKYPDAKEVDWHNNVANYEVKFRNSKGVHRAYYHMDGTWDFTETYIEASQVPAAVNASLAKSRFSDWKLGSTSLVENNKGQKLYRLEVKKGIEKKFVFYDKNGKEIKTAATS